MWTCDRLDLQTLGSQPIIMPKISQIIGTIDFESSSISHYFF